MVPQFRVQEIFGLTENGILVMAQHMTIKGRIVGSKYIRGIRN